MAEIINIDINESEKIKKLMRSVKGKCKNGSVLKGFCAYLFLGKIYLDAYYYDEGTPEPILYKEYDWLIDFTTVIIEHSNRECNMSEAAEIIIKAIKEKFK